MYDENLVTNNLNLIYYVLKKLHLYNQLQDYYDIGLIYLVKSAKKYDKSKGYTFSTYAIHNITNGILLETRKLKTSKRNGVVISFETPLVDNLTLEDTLTSNFNVDDEMLKKELYECIFKLPEREKMIILYAYGLYGYRQLTQYEISKILNLSQAQISRLVKRAINSLKEMMNY